MRKPFNKQNRVGHVCLDKHAPREQGTEHVTVLYCNESCLSYFYIVVIKRHDQQQLEKERAYFSLHFQATVPH